MNTKLRCLLLDDELPSLSYLKLICAQIPDVEVVKAFNNPLVLLAEAAALEYDLCILDIEMPGMNGLQMANLLDGKLIIFTTAYKEYAAEAYDLDVVDYVRKPVQKERLEQAIQRARARLSIQKTRKQFVQLNTDKGKALIFFDQIAYVRTAEIDSRDKTAQLFDGTTITLKNITFDRLLELLPSGDFVRVNKKELIALKTVQVFSFDEIRTNILSETGNSMDFSLSEAYRQEFLSRVNT